MDPHALQPHPEKGTQADLEKPHTPQEPCYSSGKRDTLFLWDLVNDNHEIMEHLAASLSPCREGLCRHEDNVEETRAEE